MDRLRLLLEGRATAYLAGHDHCLQHLSYNGVDYHGIGAGILLDPTKAHVDDVPAGSLKYHYDAGLLGYVNGGFGALSFSKAGLTVQYYADTGDVIYTSPAAPPRAGRR